MENNLNHKIINLYENNDFFKIYGFDFWISIIFIIVTILLIIFIYITNHFNKIKRNWKEERCNPLYVPFAGLINPQVGKSNLDYTKENLDYCSNKFMKNAEKKSLGPLYSFTNYINNLYENIQNSWIFIMANVNLLKNKLISLAQMVVQQLISTLIPIQIMFIKIKDSIGKMTGALVGSIYTFYNLYRVIKLYLLNMVQIIITEVVIATIVTITATVILIAGLIITALVLDFIPFGFIASAALWSLIASLSLSLATMIAFNTICIICMVLLNKFINLVYKDVNTPPVPKLSNKIKAENLKNEQKRKNK